MQEKIKKFISESSLSNEQKLFWNEYVGFLSTEQSRILTEEIEKDKTILLILTDEINQLKTVLKKGSEKEWENILSRVTL